MKLIAEQIEYLRKRKKELERKNESYQKYCKNREIGGFDAIESPHFMDIQEEMSNSNDRNELNEIEEMLRRSEYIVERNFDCIDIGTAFFIKFEGMDEVERTMIVDHKTNRANDSALFVSTDSDFGSSVLGHKEGDIITYSVKANGRKMTIKIDSIDRIKKNYAHFIKEKPLTKRITETTRTELKRLKKEDPLSYQSRHQLTPSQVDILKEEYNKIPPKSKDIQKLARRGVIKKMLQDHKIAPLPTGDSIQIGSFVEIALQYENEIIYKSFELINWAVSTETEGAYVERISSLGEAIYGLQKGDTFKLRQFHKPCINGVVTNVENYEERKRVL